MASRLRGYRIAMARLATPAIPWRVYRHFAVITIAITTATAMLADGEHRRARAGEVTAPQANGAASSTVKPPQASLVQTRPAPVGAFGIEAGPQSPRVMRRSNSRAPLADERDLARMGRMAIPGFSVAYLAALSDEEYAALLAGLEEAGVASPQAREQRRQALTQASLSRSGAPMGAD